MGAGVAESLLEDREAQPREADPSGSREPEVRQETPSFADAVRAAPEAEVTASRRSQEEADRAKMSLQVTPVTTSRSDEGVSPAAPPQVAPSAALGEAEETFASPEVGAVTEGQGAMAVPGMEVLMVEWEEWFPGERALHIRQLLPMGDTLELRYLGLLMGADPETSEALVTEERSAPGDKLGDRPLSPKVMEASLPPGWNQVVMRWRRGWLVARAPLSEESLRGILRSLR